MVTGPLVGSIIVSETSKGLLLEGMQTAKQCVVESWLLHYRVNSVLVQTTHSNVYVVVFLDRYCSTSIFEAVSVSLN